MKKEAITLMGTGDLLIDREKPETVFQYAADTLLSADITAANCDKTYSDKGFLLHGHPAYGLLFNSCIEVGIE
jgi:hypothetical protein